MDTHRPMTIAEAKALRYGEHCAVRLNDGRIGRVKVNGAPKTWKTRPNQCEVPVKYGLYECARLSALADGTMDRLLVPIQERAAQGGARG